MERIVNTQEDILWALKVLLDGDEVLCRPSVKKLLEEEARIAGLKLLIEDNGFGYKVRAAGKQTNRGCF